MNTFTAYENGSIRTQNMSFHATVSPSPADRLSDKQIVALVNDWMRKMGYGKQPYVLYKHHDTERPHYHIVSVRVDENGHKIPDFQERRRSLQAMKELAQQYDFEIGKGAESEKSAKARDCNPYNGFDPTKGDFSGQVEKIADLAMTYHFRRADQFVLIMEALGVRVIRKEDGSCHFIGLDPKTHKPVTAPIGDSGVRFPSEAALQKRAEACKGQIKMREKQKIANAVRIALSPAKGIKTELHTLRYLAKWGIYTQFSKTADGKIFGVTFVDIKNRCVFKASDIPGVTASQFEAARAVLWAKNAQAEINHEKGGKAEGRRSEREDMDSSISAAELSAEIAGLVISTLGIEKSRRNEDEEEDLDKGRSL